MKKILIVGLILVSLLLMGCGILNLTGFVMPDDLEFLAVVQSLDTPQKIAFYMRDNFRYKTHFFYSPAPYTLWKIEEGDCNDFATFGVFVANFHNYETYQIDISYGKLVSHMIGVYIEGEMSYTDNLKYSYGYSTFKEVVTASMRHRPKDWVWTRYTVYDYDRNVVEKGEN